MEHSELLDKIDILGHTSSWKALRAVVEKTKPRAYKNEVDEMYIKGWNAAMERVIQAIKKELG